jgi:hypothetical protein
MRGISHVLTNPHHLVVTSSDGDAREATSDSITLRFEYTGRSKAVPQHRLGSYFLRPYRYSIGFTSA